MILRGIDFGNILGASGVQGFFGEGYWFHKPWHPFGLTLDEITFVSKTATFLPRKGNMKLNRHFRPKDYLPSCIKAKLSQGLVLNAVGLSNPGLNNLLYTGLWQKMESPFMISIMPIGKTSQERLSEIKNMIGTIKFHIDYFRSPFGLQINLSCPTTANKPEKLINETEKIIEIASELNVPIMSKYSIASTPIEAILQLNDNPHCDGICVSNSIPFGWEKINWEKIWGTDKSPLSKFGGGGLSGSILRPLVCNWIYHLRQAGFTKPINGGGGILDTEDVDHYHRVGASSIFIGSVAILRPWKVKSIIDHANSLNWN